MDARVEQFAIHSNNSTSQNKERMAFFSHYFSKPTEPKIYVDIFKFKGGKRNKIMLTTMGVLAPGSVHARPFARPPIKLRRYCPAHVSAESPSNISPNR